MKRPCEAYSSIGFRSTPLSALFKPNEAIQTTSHCLTLSLEAPRTTTTHTLGVPNTWESFEMASVRRACNACRRRKVKRDGWKPCRHCGQAPPHLHLYGIPKKKIPRGNQPRVLLEIREAQLQEVPNSVCITEWLRYIPNPNRTTGREFDSSTGKSYHLLFSKNLLLSEGFNASLSLFFPLDRTVSS